MAPAAMACHFFHSDFNYFADIYFSIDTTLQKLFVKTLPEKNQADRFIVSNTSQLSLALHLFHSKLAVVALST